ncbi:MAG: LuxR C-terminal-related transcriptional regulator, partial [Candidatus Limnocylindria bacterium]
NAGDAFDAAAAAWSALGAEARAAYRRGSAAIARSHAHETSTAARRSLRQARAELLALRAMRYLDILDGAAHRRRARITRGASNELNEREVKIAILLSRGYTDQRIAEELGTTRVRVETSVAQVLSKLGVASRSQVVSWVVGRQREPAIR